MSIRRAPLRGEEALGLLEEVDELYVSRGKRVVRVDLEEGGPDRDALVGLMLGPTGNLGAPTLRRGRALLVGFDEATYEEVFG